MAMFHRSILIESAEIDFIKNAAKAKSFFLVCSEHGVGAETARHSADRAVKTREIRQIFCCRCRVETAISRLADLGSGKWDRRQIVDNNADTLTVKGLSFEVDERKHFYPGILGDDEGAVEIVWPPGETATQVVGISAGKADRFDEMNAEGQIAGIPGFKLTQAGQGLDSCHLHLQKVFT